MVFHNRKNGVKISLNFERSYKKIKALRPKMTKIASRGSCLNKDVIDCACEDACTKLVLANVTSAEKCSPEELTPKGREDYSATPIYCVEGGDT